MSISNAHRRLVQMELLLHLSKRFLSKVCLEHFVQQLLHMLVTSTGAGVSDIDSQQHVQLQLSSQFNARMLQLLVMPVCASNNIMELRRWPDQIKSMKKIVIHRQYWLFRVLNRAPQVDWRNCVAVSQDRYVKEITLSLSLVISDVPRKLEYFIA